MEFFSSNRSFFYRMVAISMNFAVRTQNKDLKVQEILRKKWNFPAKSHCKSFYSNNIFLGERSLPPLIQFLLCIRLRRRLLCGFPTSKTRCFAAFPCALRRRLLCSFPVRPSAHLFSRYCRRKSKCRLRRRLLFLCGYYMMTTTSFSSFMSAAGT